MTKKRDLKLYEKDLTRFIPMYVINIDILIDVNRY